MKISFQIQSETFLRSSYVNILTAVVKSEKIIPFIVMLYSTQNIFRNPIDYSPMAIYYNNIQAYV